jgi:hypothetical protein
MTETETLPRPCSGADCSNEAQSLQCPTCQKAGKESFFCGQDCFKRNWVNSKPSLYHTGLLSANNLLRRPSTRKSTRAQVTHSATYSLLTLCLNPIQRLATSILFLPFPSPDPCDLCTHCHPRGLCPRRLSFPSMQRMAYRGRSRILSADIRLPS